MDRIKDDIAGQAPRNQTLQSLQCLGEGSGATQQIFAMIGHSRFFSDFTRMDIELLARSMTIYRAEPGEVIIREGDVDDCMMLVMDGRVDIVKRDGHGVPQSMTSVGPGATLGEMSMIDGEPRFATCTAAEATTFAVLSRDGMVQIILEEPGIGAKILIKLVTLLSARLRQTSQSLLQRMAR